MVVWIEFLVTGGLPDGKKLVGPLGVVLENLGLLLVKLFQYVDAQLVGRSPGCPLEGKVKLVGEVLFATA